MESAVGQAMLQVSTANQWTTLSGFVSKLKRKLPANTVRPSARELATLLASIPSDELQSNGLWVTSFGAELMPIILTNPAYARARRAGAGEACSCGVIETADTSARFFGSHDYNAGRHASTTSAHKANCMCWTPPTTSHLHSWRRGYYA